MKLGILSDAHGHLEAFDIALDALRRAGAQQFVFLGDAVGYIPEPGVAERLRTLGMTCIGGNHEAMMFAANYPAEREPIYRLQEVRAALGEETRAFLRNWPDSECRAFGDTRCLFVHGSPADPTYGYVYPDADLAPFHDVEADAIFMGHTHRPFVRHSVGKLFVNVGSCGLPRDDDPRGAACLFDTETGGAIVLRFDIAEASGRALERYDLHDTVAAVLRRLSASKLYA